MNHRRILAAAATGAMLGSALLAASSANAAAGHRGHPGKTVHTYAKLRQLNQSGVSGRAAVAAKGTRLAVSYRATGLLPDSPHAVHIHYGAQARHECPNLFDDTNSDLRLTTLEGVPAYGPVAVSLTTKGDTSPASALAVDRFPAAPHGRAHYHRHVTTDRDTAKGIRAGDAVLVIHGVDHNHNGAYDFGAGKSDLDPKLPAEATDPAACGVLHR
ncbi:hypothetical protein [Actinoplanes sp. NPDC049316]|uniref:hypothetical protein n=1 Tax=Actinoplanes sp. NPDC049316 TaxID=3154727 RepID=UPI00341287BB